MKRHVATLPIEIAQENLGHVWLAATTIYVATEAKRRMRRRGSGLTSCASVGGSGRTASGLRSVGCLRSVGGEFMPANVDSPYRHGHRPADG